MVSEKRGEKKKKNIEKLGAVCVTCVADCIIQLNGFPKLEMFSRR